MKRTKQLISLILAAGLLLTSVPTSAFEPPSKAEEILQDGYASTDDAYAIYPIPQDIDYSMGGSFSLETNISVVCEDGIDGYTIDFLDEILTDYGRTKSESQTVGSGSQILLGIKGSGGVVDKWAENHITLKESSEEEEDASGLFEKTDAYLLSAQNGTIVILGKDTDAAYYGLATLQMMFSSFNGNKFLNVQIEDYATMRTRGYIEGMYGIWDYEGRESLMKSTRDVKMNTYIYASKSDPYHRSKWNEPYPEDERQKIKHLVEVGEQTKVKYAWAVHCEHIFKNLPASTDSTYQTVFNQRVDSCIAKFQDLYDLGVRKFALLNDDFPSGSYEQVVTFVNRIQADFIEPNNCGNLIYCMDGYYGNGNQNELAAMRDLDSSVELFWTGAGVNSPITQTTVDYVREKTNHEIVFWLNYPVNEHAKSGIYLGNITHYVEDNVTNLAGAVSNPCLFSEPSKVALFQLGSLFWNNHAYTEQADNIWESSFKYLQPEVYSAYLTIARNVANCPNSGRVPNGFPESEYLKETLERVSAKIQKRQPISADSDAQKLKNEFSNIISAVTVFREQCKNQTLIDNLDTWLLSLSDAATAGEAILQALFDLEADDIDGAWNNLGLASQAMSTYNTHTYYVPHDNIWVASLAGSKRLVPFINQTISTAKNIILPYIDPSINVPDSSFASFYAKIHGAETTDSAESSKIFDENENTAAKYQSSFGDGQQKTGDYFGADLGKVIPIRRIDILQAESDTDNNFYHNAVLEYSKTGNEDDWTSIKEYTNDSAPRQILVTEEELSNVQARFIRLRLTKAGTSGENGTTVKPDYWTHIREFTVNGAEPKEEEISYGPIKSEHVSSDIAVEKSNLTYRLSSNSEISLAAGEYVGIKMDDLAGLKNITTPASASALTLEYSQNGIVWQPMPSNVEGIGARYVRLYNKTNSNVSFAPAEFAVTVSIVTVHPAVSDYNPEFSTLDEANGSSDWSSLFDGDIGTYIWTNVAQKSDQFIIIDLGVKAPLYNLMITQGQGPNGSNPNPKFYNAAFYLSTDNQTWGDPIITIAENNGTITATGADRTESNGYITISKTDLDGRYARYLKIQITKNNGYKLRINEIEFNKDIESTDLPIRKIMGTNLSGNLDNIVDGDISTVYTSDEPSDGTASVTYTLTENTRLTSATFLQNASKITNAEVTAEIYDGKNIRTETLGTLCDGTSTFCFNGQEDILSLTVTWPEGTIPTLYEIITNTEESVHTITLEGNGAPSVSVPASENRFIRLPKYIPEKAGYTFKGWTDGTNTYTAGSRYKMGSADTTLTAVWEKNNAEPPKDDPPTNPDPDLKTPPAVEENKIYSYEGLAYRVTSLTAATVEVAVQKNNTLTKIVVPDTIILNKKPYKVTSVAASAFKNFKNATAATIGKNVETIGDSAFAGCVKLKKITMKSTALKSIGKKAFQKCKALKTITIKSKSLKTVGKNAFKGIHKKAVIKVPSAKYKNYVKILSKKGQAKTVKIKK